MILLTQTINAENAKRFYIKIARSIFPLLRKFPPLPSKINLTDKGKTVTTLKIQKPKNILKLVKNKNFVIGN